MYIQAWNSKRVWRPNKKHRYSFIIHVPGYFIGKIIISYCAKIHTRIEWNYTFNQLPSFGFPGKFYFSFYRNKTYLKPSTSLSKSECNLINQIFYVLFSLIFSYFQKNHMSHPIFCKITFPTFKILSLSIHTGEVK